MFVITAKVSKTKIAAAATIVIALVVLIAIVYAAKTDPSQQEELSADTNDGRVAFLAQYGWDVNADPVQTMTVRIPEKDSETFSRYNELQKSQGFDLTEHAGKKATRYVYEILNYPDADQPVYATIFVLEGKIVGGDVTNTAPDGKMHGFKMP